MPDPGLGRLYAPPQGVVEVVRKGQVKPVAIGTERRFGRNITGAHRIRGRAAVLRGSRPWLGCWPAGYGVGGWAGVVRGLPPMLHSGWWLHPPGCLCSGEPRGELCAGCGRDGGRVQPQVPDQLQVGEGSWQWRGWCVGERDREGWRQLLPYPCGQLRCAHALCCVHTPYGRCPALLPPQRVQAARQGGEGSRDHDAGKGPAGLLGFDALLVCCSRGLGWAGWPRKPTPGPRCSSRLFPSTSVLPSPPLHCVPPQGDLLKQVAAFLTEQYGIPPSLLDIKKK